MMSVVEKPIASSTATVVRREVYPLLKDLNEKKQIFRQNVVSLASELKEVYKRLSLQEQSFSRKTLTIQKEETKAIIMKKEIRKLQKSLEERCPASGVNICC